MNNQDKSELIMPRSLNKLLAEAVEKHSTSPLLIFEDGTEITYAGFYNEVAKLSNSLSNHGVDRGSLVGLMVPNIPLYPITWFACLAMGAITVPINVNYKAEDSQYIINFSEMTSLITTGAVYRDTIKHIRKSCPKLSRVFLTEDESEDDCLTLNILMEEASEKFKPHDALLTDLANILFTSGTTGYPKGCMLDHAYWLYLGKKVTSMAELTDNDRLLTAQPFYYMDPHWNLIAALMSGASLLVMKRFSPTRFWELIVNHKITWCLAIMIPLLYKTMPDDIKERHSLRAATGNIPPAIHKELEEKTGIPWRANFGMTETGADLAVPFDASEMVGTGTIGKPVWGREVRIVDDEGRSLPSGKVGEMVFRGKGLMQGYYKNDEATKKAFRNGWFHTGDYVYQDSNGWFYFKGRKKDMIRRSSENISSTEVENILKSHPKILDAAVLPVPDAIRGEEVKTYIILQDGETEHTVTPQQIVDFCTSRLAQFKIPRYFEYRKEFPRTTSAGKIQKFILKNEKSDLRANSYDRVDQVWR